MLDWLTFTANVVIQTSITIVFVTLFFFTYVSRIEKNIVVNQVSGLLKDLNAEMALVLSADEERRLRQWLTARATDTSADAEVARINALTVRKTLTTLAWIAGAGLLVGAALVAKFKLDYKEILSSAALSLIAVAATEFIFSTFFAQNYRTLDENYVKLSIIRALKMTTPPNSSLVNKHNGIPGV